MAEMRLLVVYSQHQAKAACTLMPKAIQPRGSNIFARTPKSGERLRRLARRIMPSCGAGEKARQGVGGNDEQ